MILDLGTLRGDVLLFGGPYGNLQATEALLAAASRLAIPAGNLVCTGDLVAYCAEPEATVALVRRSGAHVVMGNCEEQLAAGAADCGCGFAPGSACDAMSQQWYRYADATMSEEPRRWMGGLPRRILFRLGGRSFAVVHGGVGLINRFVFPSEPEAGLAGELDEAGTDCVIGGHSGTPFTRAVGDRVWHNAGVIGLPANDGTRDVWYSLVREAGGGIVFEHRRLAYDAGAAAARMRGVALPQGYAEALLTGRWPSLDVLPPAERERTGKPIAPGDRVWKDKAGSVAASGGRDHDVPADAA